MTIAQRIMRCRLIEEAEKNPEYAEELGLQDQSEFKDFDRADITGSSDMWKGGERNNEES